MNDPAVVIFGTHYLVMLGGRAHVVGKDRACACPAHDKSEAVYIVARYLAAGGARAPDVVPVPPRIRPTPLPPCPICGAEVVPDYVLDRAQYGRGWRCTEGGYTHLWMHRYGHLKEWYCGEGARRHAIFIADV